MNSGNGPQLQQQQLDKAYLEDLHKDPSLGIKKTYGGNGFFFVLCCENDDDVVAGFVGFQDLGEGVGELRRMTIGIKHRRGGIGGILLGGVISEAKKRNFQKITLGTWGGFEGACKFYEKWGFVVVERVDDFDEEGKLNPWGPWVTYELEL